MPYWRIDGADRSTGKPVMVEVDAPDQASAVREAGKQVLITRVTKSRGRQGPLPGMSPAPSGLTSLPPIPYATPSCVATAQPRDRRIGAKLIGGVVVLLAVAGAVSLYVTVRSPGQAKQVITSALQSRRTIPAASLVAGFEGHFTAIEETDIDGTPIRIGREIGGGGAVFRIDGRDGTARYAHLAVPNLSGDYGSMLSQFLDNAAPDFPERQAWLRQALKSMHTTKTLPDRELVLDVIPNDCIKLGVTPK